MNDVFPWVMLAMCALGYALGALDGYRRGRVVGRDEGWVSRFCDELSKKTAKRDAIRRETDGTFAPKEVGK